MCPAPIGNEFWKFRTKHGPNQKWSDPQQLWEECQKYFQWCQDNPLYEEKAFHSSGEITKTTIPKMRAMTLQGLCYYLRISRATWHAYKQNKDLLDVIHEAEGVIYEQKFTGAAADLLNANIIARDLGMSDKQEHSGPEGSPIKQEWTINFVDKTTRTDNA